MIFEGVVLTMAWPIVVDAVSLVGFIFAVSVAVSFGVSCALACCDRGVHT